MRKMTSFLCTLLFITMLVCSFAPTVFAADPEDIDLSSVTSEANTTPTNIVTYTEPSDDDFVETEAFAAVLVLSLCTMQ